MAVAATLLAGRADAPVDEGEPPGRRGIAPRPIRVGVGCRRPRASRGWKHDFRPVRSRRLRRPAPAASRAGAGAGSSRSLIAVPLVVMLVDRGNIWIATQTGVPRRPPPARVAFDRRRCASRPLAPTRVWSNGVRVFELEAACGHDGLRLAGRHARRSATTASTSGRRSSPSAASGCASTSRTRSTPQTTVHWHGMHLPAAMDGGPHSPDRAGRHVAPGVDRSISRPRPSGTTRTCTARPARRSMPGSPACSSCATPNEARARAAPRLRRRRHPGHRAGPVVLGRRLVRRRPRRCSSTASWATRSSSTARRPLPRRHDRAGAPAPAQRLERAHVRLRVRGRAARST